MLGVTRRIPRTIAGAAFAALRDPIGSGLGLVRTATSIGRALAPASVPMSPVMRSRGLGRRLDFFDLSLDDIRRAGKATEGSVNDVFVASVVGGLNRYHERHGDCPDALRMTLPINLRREGDDAAGNHFAPARFAVPITIADPGERVRAIRALGTSAAGRTLLAAHRSPRGHPEPTADHHHDRAVRRDAQVLRLRRDRTCRARR